MPRDGTGFDARPPAVRVIDRALEILGPNGEHWTHGFLHTRQGNHCIVGAIQRARRELQIMPRISQVENLMAERLHKEHFGPKRWHSLKMMVLFNNASGRQFAEIRDLMIWGREEALRREAFSFPADAE